MIGLFNVGRALLVTWIIYGMVLIFFPSVLHQRPNQMSGAVQVAIAFGLGYLLERWMSVVHRRKAATENIGTTAEATVPTASSDNLSSGNPDVAAGRIQAAFAHTSDTPLDGATRDEHIASKSELTKKCPFCAEEILTAALKCKHCGTVLDNGIATTPPASPRTLTDYEWAILGTPVAGAVLMWTWIGNMSMLQGPSSALALVSAVVVIGTAILCSLEASGLGMRRDRQNGTYSPTEWAFSLLLMWIVCYPLYLFNRRKYGVANRLIPGIFVVLIFIGSSAGLMYAIDDRTTEYTAALRTFREAVSPAEISAAAAEEKRRLVPPRVSQNRPTDVASSENDARDFGINSDKRIAAYCSGLANIGGGSYQIEVACRTEELAALRRLTIESEFPDIDQRTYRYCTSSPFDESYIMTEACIKQESEAKSALAKSGQREDSLKTIVALRQLTDGTAPVLKSAEAPLKPGDYIGYGSRIGMDVTVTSVQGIGTTRAIVRATLTRANASKFCVEYNSDPSPLCIDNYLKDTQLAGSITANCETHTFTTFYGGRFQYVGPNESPNSMATYNVKDLSDGSVLDGSSASGLGYDMEQFNALCPGVAPSR